MMAQQLESAISTASDPRFPMRARQAQLVCDAFRQRPDVTLVSLDLFGKTDKPIVAFYALDAAAFGVERDWSKMPDKVKERVKEMVLNIYYYKSAEFGKQRHVRGKIAHLLSILATREWPQRWSNLHMNMINIGLKSPMSAIITLMTFRTLSEDTHETCFFSKLPSKRKTEIVRGLQTIKSEIIQFSNQLLSIGLNNNNNNTSTPNEEMFREALLCVKSFASWVETNVLVTNPHDVVSTLCMLIRHESLEIETRTFAANCLNVVTEKKCDNEDVAKRTVLLKISSQVLESVGAALERSNVKQHVTFRRECFRILVSLCSRHFHTLFVSRRTPVVLCTNLIKAMMACVASASVRTAAMAVRFFFFVKCLKTLWEQKRMWHFEYKW